MTYNSLYTTVEKILVNEGYLSVWSGASTFYMRTFIYATFTVYAMDVINQ